MPFYDIYPVALCEGPRPISHFAYRSEKSGECNTACYIWYLSGPGPRIIVDAGADAATFTSRGTAETDIQTARAGLNKLDLEPEDIEIVIITHLHCDHIALAHLYRNAVFLVQKKELAYAQNPHPVDAILYDPQAYHDLRWEIIEGDKEIIPGISVLLTPGHSPGGQSVEIATRAGKAIITGFCATGDTFRPTEEIRRRNWEVTIPLIHQDTLQCYDSVNRVRLRADIVIPLHEPVFIRKPRIPE